MILHLSNVDLLHAACKRSYSYHVLTVKNQFLAIKHFYYNYDYFKLM